MQEDTLMAAHDEQKDGKGLATNYGGVWAEGGISCTFVDDVVLCTVG